MSEEQISQDYQKTLNLPITEFSMRAGLAQKEPKFLEFWEERGIYGQIRKNSTGRIPYILHDGPPYANGNIHIGHALNKILKDIIVKYKTMKGFDCLYVPGWDCHGLPIEHQLLKELKKRKSDVNCVEFRKSAHDYAMKYVDIQRGQFKRLGIFGEWDKPYLTLDPAYEYWILKSLAGLNKKGYVYRGLKPVNWCSKCETALAEAEVEYENHTSPAIFVKFEVENPEVIFNAKGKKLFLLVWTTTPWTIVSNVAVAVNREFNYVVAEYKNELIIVEESLAQNVFTKLEEDKYKAVIKISGEEITKLQYKHPFGLREHCRVVSADYVTKEDGTGLVHTAPGHGQDDFETGLKYGLEIVMPVNDRGVYTEQAGDYAGEYVFKANERIIEDLKSKGSLLFSENITHTYPHCWRCKSPIIFRATKQWFLNIDHENLRGKLTKEIKHSVRWIPEAGKERILSMVTGRPDWCLSRQRYWGVPIPAVECKKCGEHELFTGVIEKLAEIVKAHGSNVWFENPLNEFLTESFACSQCGSSEFEKTHDILDVWFDSGVSHQAVIKGMMGKSLPVDLYLEGSDQHRGWFQSSLIPAVALEGMAPYKAVLTHGFVVDGQGRKMSKSLGNVISPEEIIKNSGADILRLWIASSSYNEDIRISKEILDRLVDSYRKIRNTIRYLLGNLHEFNPDTQMVDYDELLSLDQWALRKLSELSKDCEENFDQFEFARAYKRLYTFCNETLSSFYLDILKDRLYTSSALSRERKSAQTVLYHILNYLIRLLAPILPFTCEEVFSLMPQNQGMKEASSVHLLPWICAPAKWNNENIDQKYALLVKVRPYVLKALEEKRRENVIGSSLEARIVINSANSDEFGYLKEHVDLLPGIFIVSEVEVNEVVEVKKGLGDGFAKMDISIFKAEGKKCSRCWNYKVDVGGDPDHETLCARCTSIVKE